jgi:hypothetical protein
MFGVEENRPMNHPPLTPLVSIVLLLIGFQFRADARTDGGNGGGSGSGWRNAAVIISPTSSQLSVGQSQQFTASVSGTRYKSVTWFVNGVAGGNASIGTVTSAGLYTAPAVVPAEPVTVIAKCTYQPSAEASATVSISSSASLVSVSVTPTSTSLQLGTVQQFSATVSGTSNSSVNWLVNGNLGGTSTVGTISAGGLYTAPSTMPPTTVVVTAQSAAQPSASANATIQLTVPPVSISISPTSTSMQLGGTQQFSASVSGTSNTSVTWLVDGTAGGSSAGGTISSSGFYTAPSSMPATPITVTAQSIAQPSASASASVQLSAPFVSVSVSPASASVIEGNTQQFSAQVSGTNNTAVNWFVLGISGGNSTVGTVTSSGLYTAPASIPSGQVVVTAQSAASPSSSANAAVTVIAPAAHSVDLSWSADSSPVAGYNIYRGAQPSGPFTKVNSSLDTATVYTDTSVVSGQTYYYAATSVDSNGIESGYSNVAQASIP